MKRVRGIKSLVHDGVDHTVDLVMLGHESAARTVMRAVAVTGVALGPAADPFTGAAAQVNGLRQRITGTVMGSIKGVNRLTALLSDAALDAIFPLESQEEPLIPLRSDAMGSAGWVADALSGAVSGVIGDHLSARENTLDPGLSLRSSTAWIGEDGSGIPADAAPRIAVLVHGLAATEWSWCLDAERLTGDPSANFGSLLERDLGFMPIFVRYNTGRHISENGRLLAARLAQLVAHWPVPVEEIALIGHSMGGLVLRSACHIAHSESHSESHSEPDPEKQPWLQAVRRVVTLGSPLQGAPLEKFGNLAGAALAALDLPATAITARLLNARSAGIKDLRYGYVQDAEWEGSDPDALLQDRRLDVALPPHISWCFIAAGLGATPGHPLSLALGDLLVRTESASGPLDAPDRVTIRHVGGVHHAAVQVHPDVYLIVRDFLS